MDSKSGEIRSQNYQLLEGDLRDISGKLQATDFYSILYSDS